MQEKEEKIRPSTERFVFTAHNGQKVELNEADMHRVYQHYIEQMTANYLRENNSTWTEEKIQAIAVETRRQMLKNNFTEKEAIEEVLTEYENVHYVELTSKQVPDSDGCMTDYTMYRDTFTGEYVFVFGDKEAYTPENSEADWNCDTEAEAWNWYNDYKGFEESIDENIELKVDEILEREQTREFLHQFPFPKELRDRVTQAATLLVELIKDIDWYHYADVTDDEELDIAEAERMIASCNTDEIINSLWQFNDDNHEVFLHDSKKVMELEDAALITAGQLNAELVKEYAQGNISQEVAQESLSPAGFQLAFLYKQAKDYLEDSEPYRAKQLFKELVDLKRDILIEHYMTMEPDIFFSNDNYVAVYQLKKAEDIKGYLFENYEYFTAHGKEIDLADYEPVYVEKVESQQGNEDLFQRFNLSRPKNYVGHSLSVSDVIVKHSFGITDASFVDSFGFKPVDSFLKEYALETNYLMHLIRQEGASYVCQSFNKETFSLHHTENVKLHQLGAHIRALDSLDDTYMKRFDVAELKRNIQQAQQVKQQEQTQTQQIRKPRF